MNRMTIIFIINCIGFFISLIFMSCFFFVNDVEYQHQAKSFVITTCAFILSLTLGDRDISFWIQILFLIINYTMFIINIASSVNLIKKTKRKR